MPEAADVEGALAGIAAAADSVDALSVAIKKAAFLDDQPGEARQRLRGRTNSIVLDLNALCRFEPG